MVRDCSFNRASLLTGGEVGQNNLHGFVFDLGRRVVFGPGCSHFVVQYTIIGSSKERRLANRIACPSITQLPYLWSVFLRKVLLFNEIGRAERSSPDLVVFW